MIRVRAASWDDVWAGPALEGAAADIGIRWRVEGTTGMARGTIGWPSYPQRTPSTLDYTTIGSANVSQSSVANQAANADQTQNASHGVTSPTYSPTWHQPRWNEVWFPDAFVGPMAQLLCALEDGTTPEISGDDNLKTMALVEACYRSANEHHAIELEGLV